MVCTGYMVETRTLTYQCHNVTVLSGVKETNGIHWQLLIRYWPAPAMVVEGIHNEYIV